jgi:hypothetical protein
MTVDPSVLDPHGEGKPGTLEPLIVTAILDQVSQTEFDRLRRAHFPPERNHLAAHLTLFHHLDEAQREELVARLVEAAEACPLPARSGEVRNLGHGVAIAVDCPELVALRAHIAASLPGSLTAQDARWAWPHVTVQNKVESEVARRLGAELAAQLPRRPIRIDGFALWRYRGGPWEPLARFVPAGSSAVRG